MTSIHLHPLAIGATLCMARKTGGLYTKAWVQPFEFFGAGKEEGVVQVQALSGGMSAGFNSLIGH